MNQQNENTIVKWEEENKDWYYNRNLPCLAYYKNRLHSISLTNLQFCRAEADSLVLAFKNGYVMWVVGSNISFGYTPTHDIYKGRS